MENKDSLDTNNAEIKKDRGDNLKRVVKPKAALKKDLEIKDWVKDRGDSVPKLISEKVINPKNINSQNSNVTERGKLFSKKTELNEVLRSKKFDDTLPVKFRSLKQNETLSKSSDKSALANLMTDRSSVSILISNTIKHSDVISKILNKTGCRNSKQHEEISKSFDKSLITDRNYVSKPIKDNVITKNTQHNENKVLHKTAPGNTKQNEETSKSSHKYAPNLITDKDSVSKSIKENIILKNTKSININKALHKSALRNTKQDEKISKSFDKPAVIKLVTDKNSVSKLINDKGFPKNAKYNEGVKNNDFGNVASENIKPIVAIIKNFEKSVPVVRKKIVETEKHVNRLDIDEKKRIREKYTFKLKAFDRNKKLDDKNNAKDSKVGDKNDILTKPNNETEIIEKASENTKSESIKIDKVLDSAEKSRKRPIIRTVIARNDATKVYKAVTFIEQKRKSNAPLQIKIPVSLINTNIPNNAATEDTKLPKKFSSNDENCKGDLANSKISQSNIDNLTRNMKTPKISQSDEDDLTRNKKKAKISQSVKDNLTKNLKPPKVSQSNKDDLTRNKKKLKISQSDKDNLTRNMKTPQVSQTNKDNLSRNMKPPKISPSSNDHLLKNTISSKLLQNNVDNFTKNVKTSKILQSKEHNLAVNKEPKLLPNSKNIKIPTEAVARITKVKARSTNIMSKKSKISNIQKSDVSLKRNRKVRMSKSSESKSSVKTKISKKEKRNRLKSKLSHFSLATGNGSPPTEVAKWAPSSITKHTQPYYEAWVDTTLAAVSRNSKKEQYFETQKLVKSFKNLLQQRDESPELMYENYLDERYTGRIKINSRQ